MALPMKSPAPTMATLALRCSTIVSLAARSGVEHLVDRLADRLDARHPVDPPDDSLGLVIRQDWCGLAAILGHAGAHRVLIVVGAALEFMAAADVAGARLDRLLVPIVIGRVADGAGEATGDPVDQGVLVHL